jgi:hypothetical protein
MKWRDEGQGAQSTKSKGVRAGETLVKTLEHEMDARRKNASTDVAPVCNLASRV